MGSLVSITIDSFLVDDFENIEGLKSLSAPFTCSGNNCKSDDFGIGLISPGYCYSTQRQILLSYYYYKNQYFYIQILPDGYKCNKFQIFGSTFQWIGKYSNENNNNNNDSNSSNSDSSFDPNNQNN